MKILSNKYSNINGVNKEMDFKFSLNNQEQEFTEFNLNTVVDASIIFNNERQTTPIYRIHGSFEFLSILNGLKKDYLKLEDFFNPQKNNCKNINDTLKFYLVKPGNNFTQIPNTNYWRRNFEVIAEPKHIDIFKASYSKNIYDEQKYSFILNIDIDLTNMVDKHNFPIDEVYLFVQYYNKPNTVPIEETTCTFWNNRNNEILTSNKKHDFVLGDTLVTENNYVISDVVEYDKNNYIQTLVKNQTFYITTPYYDNNVEKYLKWKYNPLIPLKLRFLSSYKYEVDLNNPSYDLTNDIPEHANNIYDDVYVWRNILPENSLDALTGDGNNIPFINNRRYYFKSIVLNIKPDITDNNTKNVFKEINFTKNQLVASVTPNSNINDFGKPCK